MGGVPGRAQAAAGEASREWAVCQGGHKVSERGLLVRLAGSESGAWAMRGVPRAGTSSVRWGCR